MELEKTESKEVKERETSLAEKLKARAAAMQKRELEEITVILVDASGSMAEHCKDGQTKMEAVKRSVPYLQAQGSYVEYGLVAFDTIATPVQQPAKNFAAVLIQLDNISPGSSTNIPGALGEGLKMFIEKKSEKKRMILMSDGQNNIGHDMDQRIQDCVREKVIVDTIAFGDDADINLLKSIATRTGGVFQKVDSPLQLEEAYQKLNFKVRYIEHK